MNGLALKSSQFLESFHFGDSSVLTSVGLTVKCLSDFTTGRSTFAACPPEAQAALLWEHPGKWTIEEQEEPPWRNFTLVVTSVQYLGRKGAGCLPAGVAKGVDSPASCSRVGAKAASYLQVLAPPTLTLTPVLYRQLVVLLQRQAQYSTDQWVVGALAQFTQILLQLADSSPGWGQNLLGAIGLGTSAVISVRGKFLARALHLYIR